jgi:hypothetical protein
MKTAPISLPQFARWILFCLFLALAPSVRAVDAPVPVIFKVSESVRPNAVVSLYGEYLTGASVVRFVGSDGSVMATQPPVQTDAGGHFCRVIFPAIPAGAYRLSVQNEAGWSSQSLYVNRAEPRWLSEDRAYPGLKLKLIGRNLDAHEYQGTRKTEIRLVSTDEKKTVKLAPDAVNPYCVDFSIPSAIASGEYHVEVNTHSAEYGGDWVRLDNHSEFPETVRDTILRIEPAPADPLALALKVPWAHDFAWSRVVKIPSHDETKSGAVPDETPVIQKALDDVASQGGGVVQLPKGIFRVSQLTLASGVVLRGENREGTIVMVSKMGDSAIMIKGRCVGISDLTFKYQPDAPNEVQSTLLGGVAQELFLHDVTFDMLRNPDVSDHHSPYRFTGDGPMLVAGCRFFISTANLWDHTVRNRVTFRDNFIDMHDGLGLCMSSEKLLLLNNQLIFHPAAYAGQMNGFFLNEGWMGWNIYNAYIADNVARNLNGPGDCQPYCADSAWSCLAGAVVGATANTVDVRLDVKGDLKVLENHELELIIAQGKGLGQFRRMTARQKLGGDPAVVRFTVSPAWDVVPDATSLASAGCFHVNNVFYHNAALVSKSPYNMYYGGCYDCVDAEAVSDNTEGWYNWGRIGEIPGHDGWHCPVYFDQLKRSLFTGKSPFYGTMGITLRVENETKTYRGIAEYGTEIRDNIIDRGACPDKNQRLAGNAAIATFNQSWVPVTAKTPLIFATLCEGNTIKNSAAGFDVPGSFSFAVRGTRYENCPVDVARPGYDTALLPGAPDSVPAATPAGAPQDR